MRLRAIDLLLVVALTAALLFILKAILAGSSRGMASLVAALALQSALPLAVVYLVVVRGRGLTWADLGLRRPRSRRWYWRAVLLAVASLPIVATINLLTQLIAGAPFTNPQIAVLAPAGFSWSMLFGMLLVTAVVAPVAEETVFRGLLYGWLRARIGVAGGFAISALVFAAAHAIPPLMPALAVEGVILAWIYERSGSLIPPMITHGTFNALMTVALYAALAAGALPT